MKKLLLIAVAALSLTACTDPQTTSQRTLEAMGFTNINVHGYELFAGFNCSDRDSWARDFEATGVNGQRVTGTVCGQFIGKGATVRFD